MFLLPALYAQSNGYGKSIIVVNTTNISAQPGATVQVGYTTKLYSGNTWGTTMQYANSTALANDGIKVNFSTSYGDPTFSGTLYIQISNNTNVGTYKISLYATGDDPSVNQTNITLTVYKPKTVSTTQSTTTSNTSLSTKNQSTPTSNATLSTKNTTSQITSYEYIVVIVVVIIILAAYFILRNKQKM